MLTKLQIQTLIDAELLAEPHERTKAKAISMISHQLLDVMEQNEKYKTALEWYAGDHMLQTNYISVMNIDTTVKAKEALGLIK